MAGLISELLRVQLRVSKVFLAPDKLKVTRAMQDKLGELMANTHRSKVSFEEVGFDAFEACWALPKPRKGQSKRGVVLYLHGGGYVAGNLPYAKGFASVLAASLNRRVFCAAYRLAPEFKFPTAVDDVFGAYSYLVKCGIKPSEIVLCGESAGGGLILALTHLLKRRNMELPAGLIAISPWTDLTLSGETIETNAKTDPCLTKELLEYYVDAYAKDCPNDSLASPLWNDYSGFPATLIFAGGDEMLLSDSTRLYDRLREARAVTKLVVEERMWHAYVLYGIKEAQRAMKEIACFTEVLTA